MSAEGSRFRTIDDIEDEARMRQEDEAGAGGPTGSSDSGSSDEEEDCEEDAEEEMVFNVEEEILIAESGGEGDPNGDKDSEDISEDSTDDDGKRSPASSFQARLQKVRDRYQGPLSKAAQEISDDDVSSGDGFPPWERGAEDEAFLTRIEDILEKNSEILLGRDRKQRKKLLRNLHQGYVDDYDDFMDTPEFSMPVKSKYKEGYFAAELQTQWGKDRAKKAEYKRQRQEARLLAALDPTTSKKGGKKSRKATVAASKLDPEVAISMIPNAIVDMASVEAQIRRFVANIGGAQSMALPPMDSASRKKVHQLAEALNLKSKSKGGGVGRYTTLIKTTRTGTRINEDKVNALRKRFGKTFDRAYDRKEGKGGKEKEKVPRHRDGDVVGKAAPKIGQDNVGFKLLASMGWSEGGLIGGTASVGIEAPLTARIKNSKLGLGAK
ncbi:hypothetical protein BDN67DRAFT_902575 [Paxillus ammoniavirescens]|nr:hypothetical protein BDN67DRAFT_902575 [Paxillus ammoniavirescens]